MNHPDSPPPVEVARRVDALSLDLSARRALLGQHVDDDPNFPVEVGPDLVRHALDVEIPDEKDLRTTLGQPHPPTRCRSSGSMPVRCPQSHHRVAGMRSARLALSSRSLHECDDRAERIVRIPSGSAELQRKSRKVLERCYLRQL